MEQENIQLREKVTALTNSNDRLKKENIKKEVTIIIQEKNIREMEGDQRCLLRQNIGTIIQNNKLKENLEEKNIAIVDLKSEIEKKRRRMKDFLENTKTPG